MAALAPVLDGSAPLVWPAWLVQAFLLEAIARDAASEEDAAHSAMERALDLAEPGGARLWFLLHPARDLLQRHARHRTVHPALIADILSLLAGSRPVPAAGPPPPLEPLSASEIRVLRYLPTHLSAPQIASERMSPTTPSGLTCATCTPSSALTAGPRPSSAPGSWSRWRALAPAVAWAGAVLVPVLRPGRLPG